MQFIAYFIPHILFVISQCFCGASLVLLSGPLLVYIWSGQYGFSELLISFPVFWRTIVFDDLDFYKLLVLGGASFALGMLYAEFCYRVSRRIGYHRDLGLQSDQTRDADEKEQIDIFEWKSRILKYPNLHRIWEWENFQTSFILYAEYTMLLFCPAYVICFTITALQRGAVFTEIHIIAIAALVGIFAFVFYWAMRKARIDKYRSFALTQRAIENVFQEEKASQETDKVKGKSFGRTIEDEHEGSVNNSAK